MRWGKGTFENGESERDKLMKNFTYVISYAYRGPQINFNSPVKTLIPPKILGLLFLRICDCKWGRKCKQISTYENKS